MSTVVRIGKLNLKIYANDHNPPHCHVEGAGGYARINLNTFEVMSVAGFTQNDLRKILEAVKYYEKELKSKWEEFHEEKGFTEEN